MMLGIAIPLAVLVGIILLVVRLTRRSPTGSDRGLYSLRRFLQYAFLLAALFTSATGLTRLLATALPAETMAARRTTDLALGLSLTIVAVPTWALLWRLVARRLASEPEERAAPAWSLYLVAATTVSLIVAFINGVELGQWVVGVADYRPDAVAFTVVWAAVWAAHTWLLGHRRLGPTATLPELGVLAGSVVGLIALVVGAGGLLWVGLDQVYRLLTGPELVQPRTAVLLRENLVVVALAALVWWWHWLRQASRAPRTTTWYAFVMLVPVLGGLLTAVISTGAALNTVLQWFLGQPEAANAAGHFAPMSGAVAAAVIGAGVWWYHRAVLAQGPARASTEPERVYAYLVAGVGLGAAAAGTTVAIMAALQALAGGALATADPGGRNTLILAVTMLIVGLPLWGTFWHRLQAGVAAAGAAELGAPSRRAYLFLLFGATGLTAVISLAVILYVVFRDLLDGTLATTVVYDLRAAIGLVLTAGGISAYHWLVHRGDRAAMPAVSPTHPRSVLLVSSDGRQLAASIAAGTGATVRRLHRLDAPEAPVDADDVTAAILADTHARVLVTVEEDGSVRVIPYDLE
jgi:hypothetical protein